MNIKKYYYSTQTFLAWCLNHYFYKGTHRAFVGRPFHPYLTNPDSSNPFVLYGNLYKGCTQRDEYNGYIDNKRLNMRKGVLANKKILQISMVTKLLHVCDDIDIQFFHPVVYRVDIDRINQPNRLKIANSGLLGSKEYLIDNLHEEEFDILFMDIEDGHDFVDIVTGNLNSNEVLQLLEAKCLE